MSYQPIYGSGGHPARGRAAVPEPVPWWRRWPGHLNQWVLGAGALAGALTAVLTLVNTRDKQETAAFSSVTVTASVPFGEYKQRWTGPHPAAKSLRQLRFAAAATAPAASGTGTPAPTGSGPGTGAPSVAASDGGATSTGSSAESASGTASAGSHDPAGAGTAPGGADGGAPPTGAPGTQPAPRRALAATRLPPLFDRAGIAANVPPLYWFGDYPPGPTPAVSSSPYPGNVGPCKEGYSESACGFFYQLLLPGTTASGAEGPGVPGGNAQGASATRVSELRNVRTAKFKGKGATTREPLGVVIAVNVDLGGLRGKPVLLSWSMWQAGTGKRLFGDWLNENLAYQITADTDHDTTGGDFWIPLPAVKSSYFIRARLTHGDAVLATTDSPPFR